MQSLDSIQQDRADLQHIVKRLQQHFTGVHQVYNVMVYSLHPIEVLLQLLHALIQNLIRKFLILVHHYIYSSSMLCHSLSFKHCN